MATYVAFRDGGVTNETGLYRIMTKLLKGNVAEGLRVVAAAPNSLQVAITPGDIKLDYTYGSYYGWSDSNEMLTLTTADVSHPRIDRIIAYIDTTETPSTTMANNPGLLKFTIITGEPAAAPTPPSHSTIQNSIGSSSPYSTLGDVFVAANTAQIANINITDQRQGLGVKTVAASQTLIGSATSDSIFNPSVMPNWSNISDVTKSVYFDTDVTVLFTISARLRYGGDRGVRAALKVDSTRYSATYQELLFLPNTASPPQVSVSRTFLIDISAGEHTITMDANRSENTSGAYILQPSWYGIVMTKDA